VARPSRKFPRNAAGSDGFLLVRIDHRGQVTQRGQIGRPRNCGREPQVRPRQSWTGGRAGR
jgi:hypothetical protein